jgi:hypothetical protein
MTTIGPFNKEREDSSWEYAIITNRVDMKELYLTDDITKKCANMAEISLIKPEYMVYFVEKEREEPLLLGIRTPFYDLLKTVAIPPIEGLYITDNP